MNNNILLNEAFKALEILEEEDFNLSGDYRDDLRNQLDTSYEDDFENDAQDVIDLDAETEEDVQKANIGKIILQCPTCKTIVMKCADEIELPDDIDENEDQLVMVGDECPVCFSEEGYKIIGKVAPYEEVEIEVTELDDDSENGESTETEDDATEEGAEEDTEESAEESEKDDEKEDLPDDDKEEENESLEESKESEDSEESCADLYEALNNIEFDTGSEHVSIKSEEIPDKEMIAPLTTDDAEEIAEDNMEDEPIEDELGGELGDDGLGAEDEPLDGDLGAEEEADLGAEGEDLGDEGFPEDDESDFPVDEFDETKFESLGESYFKSVYDNVTGFKTCGVRQFGEKLLVEGIIEFDSGANKLTKFLLEGKTIDDSGNCTVLAENCEITPGKKAFKFTGKLNENKLMLESMSYNYKENDTVIKGNTSVR